MNCPSPPACINPDDDPLWLIVQRDERTRCFEFPANSHKAIVVGSSNDADIRVSGAAPVAFFLEREGTTIWLTPAYADPKLRVDALKIDAKRPIYNFSLVELANVELRLNVRDTPPTLRGDGLSEFDSELSDLRSNHAAVTHNAPTVTIENEFNFDGWFDAAVGTTPVASGDTQRIEPVQLSSTPKSNVLANPVPASPVRPKGPRIGPLNVKTLEMAPIQWPPEPAVAVVKSSSKHRSEPKLDPFRTIEVAPVRLSDAKSPSRTSRPKRENLFQTTTVQLDGNAKITDTTDFEVPVVKTAAKAETIVPNSTSSGGMSIPSIPDRSPINLKTPTAANKASLGSDRLFQGNDSDRPVSASSPSVVHTLSSPSKALANLGVLAQKRPALVIGGAAIGSLVMVLFFAGAANILNPHAKQVPVKAVATQPAAITSATLQGAEKAPVNESAIVKADAAVGTAQAQPSSETKTSDTPEAIAAIPDVTSAVGHLFAGRLPEAEQAYRELSAKFPNEPAFQSASKILARKNSPTCRGASPSKTVCPSVKP